MARIAGVDLPRNKRIEISLTYIYGIGRNLSNEVLGQAGINPDTRVKDLTESEIAGLRATIDRNFRKASNNPLSAPCHESSTTLDTLAGF